MLVFSKEFRSAMFIKYGKRYSFKNRGKYNFPQSKRYMTFKDNDEFLWVQSLFKPS